MQKTILLTGATGFLGSHLLGNFIKNGHKVIALVRSTSDLWRIKEFLPECIIYEIDKISISNIFQESKIDLVVHTACSYGRKGESISSITDSNLNYGLEILESAVAYKVKTFINTDTLLPKYVNVYSLSKTQFGEWLKFLSKDIQVINMRMEHMYGPKDDKNKFVPWLINEMVSNKDTIELTSGVQKRNFIYIEDILLAYNIVIEESYNLKNYNDFDVASNHLIEVKDFVRSIAIEIELRKGINVLDRLDFGAKEYRENDVMQPEFDNEAIRELGWEPSVDYKKGINYTLNFYL
jgi:CDP-paratose synthetase